MALIAPSLLFSNFLRLEDDCRMLNDSEERDGGLGGPGDQPAKARRLISGITPIAANQDAHGFVRPYDR